VAFDDSQTLWLGSWLLAKAKAAKSSTKDALNLLPSSTRTRLI
jgi:hypothetical protein